MNKDLVSTVITVAEPFSTSHAAEKEILSTAISKSVEEKISKDSNRVKGICIKKYRTSKVSASLS